MVSAYKLDSSVISSNTSEAGNPATALTQQSAPQDHEVSKPSVSSSKSTATLLPRKKATEIVVQEPVVASDSKSSFLLQRKATDIVVKSSSASNSKAVMQPAKVVPREPYHPPWPEISEGGSILRKDLWDLAVHENLTQFQFYKNKWGSRFRRWHHDIDLTPETWDRVLKNKKIKNVILYQNGICDNPYGAKRLIRRLLRRKDVIVLTFSHLSGNIAIGCQASRNDIDENGKSLADRFMRLGLRNVRMSLVSHSMGGIWHRSMMRYIQVNDPEFWKRNNIKLDALVTIGTPHVTSFNVSMIWHGIYHVITFFVRILRWIFGFLSFFAVYYYRFIVWLFSFRLFRALWYWWVWLRLKFIKFWGGEALADSSCLSDIDWIEEFVSCSKNPECKAKTSDMLPDGFLLEHAAFDELLLQKKSGNQIMGSLLVDKISEDSLRHFERGIFLYNQISNPNDIVYPSSGLFCYQLNQQELEKAQPDKLINFEKRPCTKKKSDKCSEEGKCVANYDPKTKSDVILHNIVERYQNMQLNTHYRGINLGSIPFSSHLRLLDWSGEHIFLLGFFGFASQGTESEHPVISGIEKDLGLVKT